MHRFGQDKRPSFLYLDADLGAKRAKAPWVLLLGDRQAGETDGKKMHFVENIRFRRRCFQVNKTVLEK